MTNENFRKAERLGRFIEEAATQVLNMPSVGQYMYVTNKDESYPPYNIIEGEGTYKIELAVAGWVDEELDIELKDGKITVTGEKKIDADDIVEDTSVKFIHRGISTRKFRRAFAVSADYKVLGASLDNGILTIDLEQDEEKKPHKIKIGK